MRVKDAAWRPEGRREAEASRRFGAALRERRGRLPEEERAAAAAPAPAPARAGERTALEFRALLRGLPVAIDASRVREGAPLALSFGRSLDVELRPSPAGIELRLRPEPRLARAAAAELPGIVAALRARGVAVARAEVRARAGSGHGAPAR